MVTDKDYFHYHSSTLQWLNIIITNYDYTCMISCADPASWPFYGWWGVWGIYCGGGSGEYIYVCKGGSNAYFRFLVCKLNETEFSKGMWGSDLAIV